jgi:hypothetical protein
VFICLLSTTKSTRPQKFISVKNKIKKGRPNRQRNQMPESAESPPAALNKPNAICYNIYMKNPDVNVLRITNGEELAKAKRSYRIPLLAHPGWAESIESNRVNIFAGYFGEMVVGWAMLGLVGPDPRDTVFKHVLDTVHPGEQAPTPAAYAFRTKMQYRRLGVATAIEKAMEDRVLESEQVMPRIALAVEVKNKRAVDLYDHLGYRILIADGQAVFSAPAPKHRGQGRVEKRQEDLFFMAKDLSP